jgi:hypothetical protein
MAADTISGYIQGLLDGVDSRRLPTPLTTPLGRQRLLLPVDLYSESVPVAACDEHQELSQTRRSDIRMSEQIATLFERLVGT